MLDDVRDLVGVEARVDRHQHSAGERHAEVGEEERLRIDGEKGDPVAFAQPVAPERGRQTPRPGTHLLPAQAHVAVGDSEARRVHFACALEEMDGGQFLPVHGRVRHVVLRSRTGESTPDALESQPPGTKSAVTPSVPGDAGNTWLRPEVRKPVGRLRRAPACFLTTGQRGSMSYENIAEKNVAPAASDLLLGRGVRFEGKLTFAGTVRIDASFVGTIVTDDVLVVGEGARIDANITCGNIVVHGEVNGNVQAKNGVEIRSAGKVRGDLETASLVVEKGAFFQGASRMDSAKGVRAKTAA